MRKKNPADNNKIIFLILDGWGIYESYEGNAIALASTPVFNKLVTEYPTTALDTGSNSSNKQDSKSKCEYGHYALGGLYDKGEEDGDGLVKTFLSEEKRVLIVSESERNAQMAHYYCHGDKGQDNNFTSTVISSPKLDSYLENPELSLSDVANSLVNAINSEEYDLIVGNIANADILAHTGDMPATIAAIETIDKLLKRVIKATISRKNILVICSDHGNAEYMINKKNNKFHLNHTSNPVPLILVGQGYEGRNIGWPDAIGDDLSTIKTSGHIVDVAPALLSLSGIKVPLDMKGKSLINN
jgi:bisphosphoglycerate-independent phosphoglycerate mutase (AlkP superfamily)